MRYTAHETNGFASHLKDEWLSVLLKDTSVRVGDSNPHSADQKHQSEFGALLKPLGHDTSTLYSMHAVQLVASTKLPEKLHWTLLPIVKDQYSHFVYPNSRCIK